MEAKAKIYTATQKISAWLMALSLLWLTVSAPFVFACQQKLSKQHNTSTTQNPLTGTEEETANPLGNSTEEKKPASNSFSEEYLHDANGDGLTVSSGASWHKNQNAGTYIAFHGELLVPPPNLA